ncbi:aspartyl-phosphate phosphatase Spo0E family protein [Mesobacillus foraminis]|nr:aspartyl-phosphate phosphatase Spo0E family protein [Mesobacillus foraminis]
MEFLRKDLIRTALKFGFSDQRTIQASQELDFFIFEYQKMIH